MNYKRSNIILSAVLPTIHDMIHEWNRIILSSNSEEMCENRLNEL